MDDDGTPDSHLGVLSTHMFHCHSKNTAYRVMELADEVERDPSCALQLEELIASRVAAAVKLRSRLGLPSAETSVYRLINR